MGPCTHALCQQGEPPPGGGCWDKVWGVWGMEKSLLSTMKGKEAQTITGAVQRCALGPHSRSCSPGRAPLKTEAALRQGGRPRHAPARDPPPPQLPSQAEPGRRPHRASAANTHSRAGCSWWGSALGASRRGGQPWTTGTDVRSPRLCGGTRRVGEHAVSTDGPLRGRQDSPGRGWGAGRRASPGGVFPCRPLALHAQPRRVLLGSPG